MTDAIRWAFAPGIARDDSPDCRRAGTHLDLNSRRSTEWGSREAGNGAAGIDTADRARLSAGATTSKAVYDMVVAAIAARRDRGGILIDVGCGSAQLFPRIRELCDRYLGVDIVRYDGFPPEAEFVAANLDDCQSIPLPDGSAEAVVAVETIEHLENPRRLVREMVRLAKPGGLVLLTTPNQLSWLSLATLLVKGQFNQFQDAPGSYPAHIRRPRLFRRIARECGLHASVVYSDRARPADRIALARYLRAAGSATI